jgi:hypothetical protein
VGEQKCLLNHIGGIELSLQLRPDLQAYQHLEERPVGLQGAKPCFIAVAQSSTYWI